MLRRRMTFHLTMLRFDCVGHVPHSKTLQTRMNAGVWDCGTSGTQKHIPYIESVYPANYEGEYILLTRKRKCANLSHSPTTLRKPA